MVPLIMNEPAEVTMAKLTSLNGVLFPGGGGDYYDFGQIMWDYIIE